MINFYEKSKIMRSIRTHKFQIKLYKKFLGDISGNVAITTALLFFLLLASIGVAIDYTNLSRIKTKLQASADAAVLAAVTIDGGNDQDNVNKIVADYFAVRETSSYGVQDSLRLKSEIKNAHVEVTASLDVPLFIMGIFGKDIAKVKVAAYSPFAQGPVEMALVIDNTSSMNYGSFDTVSDAIGDVLDVIEAKTDKSAFHVTLVPFTDRVNITLKRRDWLKYRNGIDDWEGCVEPNEISIPNFPYALDFDVGKGDLIPSVAPYWSGSIARGPARSECANPIIGPTTDIELAKTKLDQLKPLKATGRFDDALVWGWRAVTKRWQGRWDNNPNYPSSSGNARKIVALFTDGKTNINKYEMESAVGEYGNNNGSISLFSHFKRACDFIKKDGVDIYIFDTAENPHARPHFKDCAGANYYRTKGTAELVTAIQNLRGGNDEARLSK